MAAVLIKILTALLVLLAVPIILCVSCMIVAGLWMRKKYGQLGENWREMLHNGFRECMRVLKPDGVLIFKWAETQIPAADVWAAIGGRPLFGHHSGKKSQTFWGCFMKLEDA